MHIVWIKTELLHPVHNGGRIRTYNMLRALARQHRITYLALDDGTVTDEARALASEYCARLETVPLAQPARRSAAFFAALAANLFSPHPYAVVRWRSAALEARLRQIVAAGDVDVVVCDFLAPTLNVPRDLGVPVVLFQHNVEAMIWQRHAEVAGNPLARRYMATQWRRMRALEASECRRYTKVIAVSDADAEVFEREYGVVDPVAVPTGVDTEYFRPADPALRRPGAMCFIGSMDWLPNEDGVGWFCDAVLPRIREAMPGASLAVVGRNPSARVRALHDPARGVTVTGSVPDVRPHIASASLCVVPLRIGGGTRLKIFEGMAMALPTVSTAVGAEGLPVTDGVHLALADEADAFADACIALLRDPARARAMGAAADAYVREHFGWDGVARRFADACAAVAAPASPASSHLVARA